MNCWRRGQRRKTALIWWIKTQEIRAKGLHTWAQDAATMRPWTMAAASECKRRKFVQRMAGQP